MRAPGALAAAGLGFWCACALAVGCALRAKGAEDEAASCGAGLAVLEGACVARREADAYCGAEGSSEIAAGRAACIVPHCPSGDGVDPARGRCVPARSLRVSAARDHHVPSDATLACHAGHVLAAHDEHVTCLAVGDACPRGSRWEAHAGACVAEPACRPGAMRSAGECVAFVAGSGIGRRVDVATWARIALGADGGEGSAGLCRAIAQQPWAFDVGPGGARSVRVTLELLFPDNDVTQVTARADTEDAASGTAVGSPGARVVEAAVASLLVPLRSLGGTASAASASARVRCDIRGGASPLALPGGAESEP